MAAKDVLATAIAEPKSVARRLWRVVRAVLYMMRRGLPSARKLAMDLHLLLRRGKLALVNAHAGRHHHRYYGEAAARPSSFSCSDFDPALAVREPSRGGVREVEFSCSNTPCKRRGKQPASAGYYHNYDAADVARVFEMLNDGEHLLDDAEALAVVEATTPSHAPWAPSPFRRSPAGSRLLRLAGSPFSARDDDGEVPVDTKADEFIRRFYEQLQAQKSVSGTPTPDYYGYAARSYNGRSPRPVSAGIA